jgi:hypothetical protein
VTIGIFDPAIFDPAIFDTPHSPGFLYWGPHFPDAARGNYFGRHFPDGVPAPATIPPSGPGGAATFLLLEAGSKLTLQWGDDVRKMWGGAEYRAQTLDDPKRTFVGEATLLGDATRATRAALARFAAIGSTFLLALPYEAITISGTGTGATIPTSSTTLCDWMQLGQRVVVVHGDGTALDAVIQSFTSSSVTIDVDPDAYGGVGGSIMPTVPIYFDPQMTFVRSIGTRDVEQWQLNARAAVFGFPITARQAIAELSAATGALDGIVLKWTTVGAAGNAGTFRTIGDLTAIDPLTVTSVGAAWTVHYCPGTHTVGDLAIAMFIAHTPFDIYGTYTVTEYLTAGDAIGPVAFHGGADTGYGTPGAGATVATYDTRPVWDHGLQVEGTATDSIQSLAELVDMGGLPISIGTAKQADWGRALYLKRTSREDWQWLKAFLAAVRGKQRAFWLSSYRNDLKAVSYSGLDLIIRGPADADGGLPAWWPTQRDRIEVVQADGNKVYAQIQAAVDNLDGTMTLTLGYDGSSPSMAAITRVSWLELVRFDSDSFEVVFDYGTFTFSANARVVQQ